MLNSERKKLVIDLYKNRNKSIREIAQEARMSFRDIDAILRKVEETNKSDVLSPEEAIVVRHAVYNVSKDQRYC